MLGLWVVCGWKVLGVSGLCWGGFVCVMSAICVGVLFLIQGLGILALCAVLWVGGCDWVLDTCVAGVGSLSGD